MNWVLASLLMFLSSVFLYLLVRKTQLLKVPLQINNLFQFIIIPIISLIFLFFLRIPVIIPFKYFALIIFSAFFFGYLGNRFSLLSMQHAPNPGYSLIIGKSYVVFTTLVSIVLFGSELTLRRAFAIILIVLFSALISIQKRIRKGDITWLLYAIGSFFCWGFLALLSKYLITQKISIFVFQFFHPLFMSIIMYSEAKIKKVNFSFSLPIFLILILMGICNASFNIFMQLGFQYSPNPGYINAVNASSISMVTILSALFYKDELSVKKIIGVIGVTFGLILLLI